jgi:hypothetical protein
VQGARALREQAAGFPPEGEHRTAKGFIEAPGLFCFVILQLLSPSAQQLREVRQGVQDHVRNDPGLL